MNKWSKYIDQDFSFSNEVTYSKSNTIDNLSLEPRLQEYIKKKKYYVDNHIYPDIPIEREYSISPNDITIIKKYINGIKVKPFTEQTANTITKQYFPSKTFRDSEQKNFGYVKQKKLNEFDPKYNYNLLSFDKPNNTINEIKDFRDLSSTFNIDDTRFDPRIDKKVTNIPGNIETKNKLKSQYNINKCRKTNVLDTELQQGIPSRTSKSYGYKDIQEHNYQYLDNKCQNPDNSILSRSGESTRIYNKQPNMRARNVNQ